MHYIVSNGGLTKGRQIHLSSGKFFLPVRGLRDKFKRKFLASLVFSSTCSHLKNSYSFKEFKEQLYEKDWCPYIKETFRGFGNAVGYLGRYTHKIAISESKA